MFYKDKLISTVDDFLNMKELPTLENRIKQVESICEWYYQGTDKKPPSYELERMANYLLADTLRDKNTHKVKTDPFPILSYTQQKLRNRRENRVGDEHIDYIRQKEVKTNPNLFKARTQNMDEV